MTSSVTVLGMGKIGTPIACAMAAWGDFSVVYGFDTNEETVSTLRAGKSHVSAEPDLESTLEHAIGSKKLQPTSDGAQAIASSEILVVAVPLSTDPEGRPNFSNIDAVADLIGDNIHPGTTVILETTVPIGTTTDRFGKRIAQLSGLGPGEQGGFFLAFSPERVSSGSVFRDLRSYPKVVGGWSEQCESNAANFYRSWIRFDEAAILNSEEGIISLGSPHAAEFSKLAETTYRDVNISLANSFQTHASDLGLDFQRIARACNTQPFSHLHQSGIAVGGHCIPVYPHLYLQTDPGNDLVRTARRINQERPSEIMERAKSLWGSFEGLQALVVGAAYREGVREVANSGVFPIASWLRRNGARVEVYDPLFSDDELENFGLKPAQDFSKFEVLVVHTESDEFRSLSDKDFPMLRYLIDGRNSIPDSKFTRAKRLVL